VERNHLLHIVSCATTYVGLRKVNWVVSDPISGEAQWVFTDPHFGDNFVAYEGTLERCQALQAEYEKPCTDQPF
jgi:hypothetical protein